MVRRAFRHLLRRWRIRAASDEELQAMRRTQAVIDSERGYLYIRGAEWERGEPLDGDETNATCDAQMAAMRGDKFTE